MRDQPGDVRERVALFQDAQHRRGTKHIADGPQLKNENPPPERLEVLATALAFKFAGLFANVMAAVFAIS